MTRCYAGVGSRRIYQQERLDLLRVGGILRDRGWILYSGNAPGTDQTIQSGALWDNPMRATQRAPVRVFLPMDGFQQANWDYTTWAQSHLVCGDDPEGQQAVTDLHPLEIENRWRAASGQPLGKVLSPSDRRFLARNYKIIHGHQEWPAVKFVLCCADPLPGGHVEGGTGQAIRVAIKAGIPVINMRIHGWEPRLIDLVVHLENQHA